MNTKRHPYLEKRNIVELLLQTPFWVLIYGSGLVFPLAGFTWLIYGLGLYKSPKLYPLPHTALLELVAEYLIWVRLNSNYSGKIKKLIIVIASLICIIILPLVFIYYFKFIFWFWFGDKINWFSQFIN